MEIGRQGMAGNGHTSRVGKEMGKNQKADPPTLESAFLVWSN